MYLKNTPQFNLLKNLYDIEKKTLPDAEVRTLGLAHTKLERDISVIDRLETDGYLKKFPREKWIAVWITPKGIDAFQSYLDSIPPPPSPKPSPEQLLIGELKQKLSDKTITPEEKDNLLLLVAEKI